MTTSPAFVPFGNGGVSQRIKGAGATEGRSSTRGMWQRRRKPWLLRSLTVAIACGWAGAVALGALLVRSSLVSYTVTIAFAATFGVVVIAAVVTIGWAGSAATRAPVVDRTAGAGDDDRPRPNVDLRSLLAEQPVDPPDQR